MANQKKRTKRRGKHSVPGQGDQALDVPMWYQDGDVHALVPGSRPTPEQLAEITKEYQRNIRNSPLWDQMVAKCGLEKAEALLRECKAEMR